MIGEQFMVGDEICGAVVSVRFQVRKSEQRPPRRQVYSIFYGTKTSPVGPLHDSGITYLSLIHI